MRFKKYICIVLLSTCPYLSSAQGADLLWQKSFGGAQTDIGYSACNAVDSGYIIATTTYSSDGDVSENAGLRDFWIINSDLSGNIIWQKNYGGSSLEELGAVLKTSDSCYVFGGTTYSADGDIGLNFGGADCVVMKLSKEGEILWLHVFGGSKNDWLTSIIQTIDGGYIFTGHSRSDNGIFADHSGSTDYPDLIVVKLNSLGELEWSKSYGGINSDEGNAVIQTTELDYVVVGYTSIWEPTFDFDYWILRIDVDGNIIWDKKYGGTKQDYAFAVAELYSKNLIVTGEAWSDDGDISDSHGLQEAWTILLDEVDGEIIWKKSFGGSCAETGRDILMHADSTISIIGSTCSPDDGDILGHHGDFGYSDYWIFNIDTIGIIRWQQCFGGTETDQAYNASLTLDTSILITGSARSNDFDITDHHSGDDAWTIKIKNACNAMKYYPDLDDDGFGDIASMYIYSCNDSIGFESNNLDCNDSIFSINPSVKESCNYFDDNCNGLIDEGFAYLHTFEDFDGDVFGNENIDSISCVIPEGFVLDSTDCDDNNAAIYPGAVELLNGLDDDCDQIADEGLAIDNQEQFDFSIYPNPTDNFVTIINDLNLTATVQVFNNVGQAVIANKEFHGNEILLFENLPSGIYLIEITTSNKKESIVLIRN